MKLFLPQLARESKAQHVTIRIKDRLPPHILNACELVCEFSAKAVGDDYYLLSLNVSGQVEITCQRCMAPFLSEFKHEYQLAVCDKDEISDTLMENYECIVTHNYHIDLVDILTDDIHLYTEQKHKNIEQCSLSQV